MQSKDTFIIDLIDTKKRKQLLQLFDFVEFRHGAADNMFFGTLSSGFTHYYSLLQTAIQ